jgi:carbamoylphosphate synthase large subunit
VIAVSNDRINMSRFSRYCTKYEYLPDPITKHDSYLQELAELIRKYNVDVLIPMEDETVELIIRNIELFHNIDTLLPDIDTFMTARDKGKTMEKAIELGISCPDTYFIKDLEDLKEKEVLIKYPAIIKARISSGSRGLMRVNQKNDLTKKYQEVHENYPLPIVQQYITGNFDKIQVLLMLDKNSKAVASCTYQGIREFPVNGGPVTMWKTISLPEIENKTIEFLEKLNWVGFAEVEYIIDQQTGEYYLMEVNPRFSANIALAVHVGIDFPYLFTKLATNEKVDFKRNNKFNEYCQWLVPGDILNFIFNKKRFDQEIGYFFKKPKNLHYAILSKDDPIPMVGNVLSMVLNLFSSLKNLKAKLNASRK